MTSVSSVLASGDPMVEIVAQAKGYFHQHGLTVTMTRTASGSSDVPLLVSGQVQFMLGGSATLLAAQQGAPLRLIMAVNKGSDETLVISSKAAAAHHIPTRASTTAEATRQLEALKGSHLTIGVTNTAGDGYNFLAADLKAHGVTVGPGKDVNVISTGGAPQLVAAYRTGKIDGFSITPPYTFQPDSVQIPLSLITPDVNSAFFYLLITDRMVQQHPDTVQAFVDSMIQGWQFATAHPSKAGPLTVSLYNKYIDPTSTSQEQEIFQSLSKDWNTVILSPSEFTATRQMLEDAQPSEKLSVTFSSFVDMTFVDNALKTMGITMPSA